ncbi:MAG: glycoside hydrolase family 2 protein, partial [Limisphaerales bacterium]
MRISPTSTPIPALPFRGGLAALVLWGILAAHPASIHAAAAWSPVAGPLMTRWAGEVDPERVLPEYPRPQLVRKDWLSLNGLWEHAITAKGAPPPARYDGPILVPFPIESALSGVMKRFDEGSVLWYRRTFTVPPAWAGKRIRLHFGAVDWEARVWLNDRELATHRGGYDAFTLELDAALRADGGQTLVIAVTDPTEDDQPRGKQSRKPEGIFYTPCSGIWQTVWLEPVPSVAIDTLHLVPDLDAASLRVRVNVDGASSRGRVAVVALADGQPAGRVAGAPGSELTLKLDPARAWSPQDPFLYDLRVELSEDDQVVDRVDSYFGLRKVSVGPDEAGLTRLLLNNRFLFQIGTLDQGFWPDGIYTAPTDAALRYDLEVLKELGFNLVRKHVKVEPARWYYWCDKLGLLVWQDMPSGNNGTEASRRQFEAELESMIRGLRHHPSIILWVVFNEGWGQYDTERLTRWVKDLDPSRLVSNASGWTDRQVGDVIDLHMYPGPGSPPPEAARAAVLGEFGGLGLAIEGHTWTQRTWGYQGMATRNGLTRRYVDLLRGAYELRDRPGLSAAVYTQTTDVETECNGLLTYDREIVKPAAE